MEWRLYNKEKPKNEAYIVFWFSGVIGVYVGIYYKNDKYIEASAAGCYPVDLQKDEIDFWMYQDDMNPEPRQPLNL